jgi:hypothetical protein
MMPTVLGFGDLMGLLMALKPDAMRGRSLKLVSAWEKPITVLVIGCVAKFSEQKECNRHVRESHTSMTESQVVPSTTVQMTSGVESGEQRPIRGVISTLNGTTGQDGGGSLFQCTVPGFSRSYKTSGWLAWHIKSSHGLEVPNDPITPSSAMTTDVRLPIGEMAGTVILAGRTPSAVSPNIPVSSWGDGSSGRIRVWQSQPTGGQAGCI